MSLPPPSLPSSHLRAILNETRSIAVIGASPDPARDSHEVMGYLQRAGYRVWPVNPLAAGQTIHGIPVVPSLASVTEPVDMIDVFRRNDAVAAVIDEAISQQRRLILKSVWLQLGVRDDVACGRARAAGLTVIADRCLMVVHRQLLGY